MSEYVLSCCASCDLNPEWMKRRNLPYAFFNVTLDGLSVKDDMGLSFSPRELIKRMEEGADTKTSQVSLGEYQTYFEEFLKEGKDPSVSTTVDIVSAMWPVLYRTKFWSFAFLLHISP